MDINNISISGPEPEVPPKDQDPSFFKPNRLRFLLALFVLTGVGVGVHSCLENRTDRAANVISSQDDYGTNQDHTIMFEPD